MATHHSVSDWDMSGGWLLDSSTYISSPSSIRFSANYGGTCKKSEVWNLSQGMIITYAKADYNWGGSTYPFGPLIGFRNQATTGSGLDSNARVTRGYTLLIDGRGTSATLWINASTLFYLTYIAKPANFNVWNKYRLTWWSDTGGGGLFVRLEYWDGANWVKMINDWNDSADKYKDSTVNRVSLGSYYTGYVWFDDTEIWGV